MAEKPTHIAYAVQKVEDADGKEKPQWTEIGAVFSHRDGKGMTIQLRAFPVSASIVCREPNEGNPTNGKK